MMHPNIAQVLICLILVNAATALGHLTGGIVHKDTATEASSGGFVMGTRDEQFIAIESNDRHLDDVEGAESYNVCESRCEKVESFFDLEKLINYQLSRSAYGKGPVKIGICPSYKPIYWPFDKSIIIEDEIKLTLECCGENCIIDGGSQLPRKRTGYDDVEEVMRLFALITIRNASHVEVKGMTFQNVPSATNSSGSVLSFESATDLTISHSTFSNIKSINGAINIYNGEFIGTTIGSVTLADNKFLNNHASNDGGVIRTGGLLKLYRNLFRGNHADGEGGSVFFLPGRLFSENNIYKESTAGTDGGAIYVDSGHAILKNDLYIKCGAEDGGAVHSTFSKTEISKSKFYDNGATNGGAVYFNLGMHSSELNEYKNNVAATGGAIYVDSSLLQSSRDVFEYNAAAQEGGDIYVEQSALYYCQTKFLKKTSLSLDSVSLAEKKCGEDKGYKVDNNYKVGCDVIRTFKDLKELVETQLAMSSGSSVHIKMCANNAEAPVIWNKEDTLLFKTKVHFTFDCVNGNCAFDGDYVDGDIRPSPAFEFLNVTKIDVNNMVFKNFAPVNSTIPAFFAEDGTIFDFNELAICSISKSWFEGIKSQRGIINANEATELKLVGNTFIDNMAVDVGLPGDGGVTVAYVNSGYIEAADNLFQGNVAENFLGVFALFAGFQNSKKNRYVDNSTPNSGSALSQFAGYMKSTYDVFTSNTATDTSGGALGLFFGLFESTNSKFAMNKAVGNGGVSNSFSVTFLSENCKYTKNMASFGGAITADVLLMVSKNDVFQQNVASGPIDDPALPSQASSSSLGVAVEVPTDVGDLYPSPDARKRVAVSSSPQGSRSNPESTVSDEKFGDDVYVQNGSAFFWCGSKFSSFLSVIGEVGGDALFKKQCGISYT